MHTRICTGRHNWLINIARNLKISHQTGDNFITCFALKGNKILTIACNNYEITHPEAKFGKYRTTRSTDKKYYKACLHAEIAAIKQLGAWRTDFHKIELFVVRIGNEKDMPALIAKPCINCERVIKQYRFKRVEFTTNNSSEIGILE